ncbi:hypothetical protein MSPP1_002090 [Malassezia sp. CBS 17886]|nr:hypothetical protein MSPP1_002090 [Malassezia sp. CBS 17886]
MAEPWDDELGLVLVVSGGSGYNDLVSATPNAIFVMPVSDNGGGPSLGDIRSRLVRLAATAATYAPPQSQLSRPGSRGALHALLSYRLPIMGSMRTIKQEWMDIIEGKHRLWHGIDLEKRECVRGFLVHFESDVLHRAHRNFNFRGGSIGNFFLASMQRFFRSIQSAIFLFAALTGIPTRLPACQVLPAINTNKTTTIAARLENGGILVGQCEISHPTGLSAQHGAESNFNLSPSRGGSPELLPDFGRVSIHEAGLEPRLPPPLMDSRLNNSRMSASTAHSVDGSEWSDDELSPGMQEDTSRSMPLESLGNLAFRDVTEAGPLPSPIRNVFYVNSYRNEIFPTPNPAYVRGLQCSRMLVYSCGSLWTSIVPCLALRGIGSTVARSPTLEFKVLLLNSSHDRETFGMNAVDFVQCVTQSSGC